MHVATPISDLTQRELVELWCVTFGEPPPVVHDPALMLRLVEAALKAPTRRPQHVTRTGA